MRKVYGQDHIRLLRCRTCGEEFSERRGTALFNTKVAEARAASIVNHLGEGCGVRATARVVHVAKDTVARLLRMAGRHAARFHDAVAANGGQWLDRGCRALQSARGARPGERDD